MKITANGNPLTLPDCCNISGLLVNLNIEPTRAVVEHNGLIVERAKFNETTLADGDRVEIVRFVGGG